MTVKEPVGVGAITPWNFPLLIVSQKLPFALAVGCTAVVKPSDLTPGTTTRLVQILHEEGLPPGVAQPRPWRRRRRGRLSAHPGTQMTTFTGSTRVGRLVAQAAAKDLKKVSLECRCSSLLVPRTSTSALPPSGEYFFVETLARVCNHKERSDRDNCPDPGHRDCARDRPGGSRPGPAAGERAGRRRPALRGGDLPHRAPRMP